MKYADYTQAVNGTNNTSVMTPLRVKQAIQANGSGEGGTSNYTDLENKPKINGVTLEGDKSSSDLGISVPSVDNETIIDSPNLTAIGVKESSGNVDRFLTLTLSEYNAIENKDPNTFYNIIDDTDPSTIPTKTSDLINDSGYITSSYHDDTKVDKDSVARLDNVVSRNMLNLNTISIGGLDENGTIVDSSSVTINNLDISQGIINFTANAWRGIISDFIKVDSGSALILSGTFSADNYFYRVVSYNANKEFISFFDDFYTMPHNISIPDGVSYIRILLGRGAEVGSINFNGLQLEEGSTANAYTPYLNLEEAMQENDIYSTNEIKIGNWIDGKPLYRKVIQPVIEIGANATVSVPHGISNLSQVLKVDATLFWSNKTYPFPAIYEDLSKQVVINYIDSTNVYIKSFGDNWASQITTIILEYTKTTD